MGKVKPNVVKLPPLDNVGMNSNLALQCPAQAFPAPLYRTVGQGSTKHTIVSNSLFSEIEVEHDPSLSSTSLPKASLQLYSSELEPVSSAGPKVSSKSKYDVVSYKREIDLALICPAQGFPGSRAPTFTTSLKGIWVAERSERASALLCQAQGYPDPIFSNAKRTWFEENSGKSLAVLCQAQGYPAPIYSAPLTAVKIEMGKGVGVLCQAQGYPRPNFSFDNLLGIEPVGLRAPSLQADIKSITIEKTARHDLSLLCQAQGFPMPVFRKPNLQADSKLKSVERTIKADISLFCQAQEPIGVRAPVFSSDNLINAFARSAGSSFGLLCQAQGLPVPKFRRVSGLNCNFLAKCLEPIGSKAPTFTNDLTIMGYTRLKGQSFAMLCPAQKPLGSRAPSFTNDLKSMGYERQKDQSFALLCPAQALPLPTFRTGWVKTSDFSIRIEQFHLIVPEPIGLKAPSFSNDAVSSSYVRGIGASFGLLCQAQAFPVPNFRYVLKHLPSQVCRKPSPSKRGREQTMLCCVQRKGYQHRYSEPIGSRAPTFSSDSKTFSYDRKLNSSFALLCPAQGILVNPFSCDFEFGVKFLLLEPVGYTPPRLPPKSKLDAVVGQMDAAIVLICDAQSYPAPRFSFRTDRGKRLHDLSSRGLPYPKIQVVNYLFLLTDTKVSLEPTGNIVPKVPGKKYDGGKLEYWESKAFVALTCEIVGYPVPKYRRDIVIAEPTNNIAPKALDKKIGYTLILARQAEDIFLMCPVVGYPVPIFRAYWKCTTEIARVEIRGWEIVTITEKC
ncbi:hypothetical protein Trydic_g17348 [Trypoxylus dichotomus]